ncbi:MAG: hypothetical protein HKN80_02040 [Acidimicrobiia bacterium]|nr:hypothetical protein [Acidimicrobiia bacterium]
MLMRYRMSLVLWLALLVAACGSGDEAAVTSHAHAAGEPTHAHSMSEMVEAVGPDLPSVVLTVTADPVSGFNVYARCTNLTWAPDKAGLDHVDGEGHGHLYVDGEKVARIYGEWYHLTGLAPGTHEVKVSLNANTHAAYAVDGVEVADSVTIEVG